MTPRRLFQASLFVLPLFLTSLACNYLLSPFIPPTPTPTIAAISELPRHADELRPPTETPTPTVTPTPTNTPEPTITPSPTASPSPTIDAAKLVDPDRPRLSGNMLVFGTEHFLVHYTVSGQDAVVATDVNSNGTPDYVEAVGEAMELSWQVEIVELGWAEPPSDGGLGGDSRYDVYLEDIYDDGTAGYTDGGYLDTMVGDNPNTVAIENDASHSYISLDNDYLEDNFFSPLELMQVTAAHEFNHAIQFGLDSDEPAEWLWEATATWMEDMVYDHINDAVYYLGAVFDSTGTCQIAEESPENEYHWYGMWIYFRYISETYGPEVIRTIWENTVSQDGYGAIESGLESVGTSLDEVYHGFVVALLTRGFEEGVDYPSLRLKGEVEMGRTFNPEEGVYQMAADFVAIIGQENIIVNLQGIEHGLVVGLRNGDADVFAFQEGQVFVDASQYDHLYGIVLNLNLANREPECRETLYTLEITPGEQSFLPDKTLPAPNFSPPRADLLP